MGAIHLRSHRERSCWSPAGSAESAGVEQGLAGKCCSSGGRCFICLKPGPSPSCRFCWLWWGSAAPSGNGAALGVGHRLCPPKRSPSCFGFWLLFFFFFLAFSFLRYPWHPLATSGTIHFLFHFHRFPFFLPQFCPRGRVRAPALGLVFAAFNENSAEAIYIFFKQMKQPCNYSAILITPHPAVSVIVIKVTVLLQVYSACNLLLCNSFPSMDNAGFRAHVGRDASARCRGISVQNSTCCRW